MPFVPTQGYGGKLVATFGYGREDGGIVPPAPTSTISGVGLRRFAGSGPRRHRGFRG